MNKKYLKIIYSIVALIIITICLVLVTKAKNSKTNGEIYIILIDLDGIDNKNGPFAFTKDDSLVSILDANFDLIINNGFLVKINSLDTSGKDDYFIEILINGKFANRGIKQIQLSDQDIITFKMSKIRGEA